MEMPFLTEVKSPLEASRIATWFVKETVPSIVVQETVWMSTSWGIPVRVRLSLQ